MHARVEAEFYAIFLNYLIYIGVFLFITGLVVVAGVGSNTDLYVIMVITVPLIGLFVYILISTKKIGRNLQRESVYQFYEMYCDFEGRLLPQYLRLVYDDFDKQIQNLWHVNDDINIDDKIDENR